MLYSRASEFQFISKAKAFLLGMRLLALFWFCCCLTSNLVFFLGQVLNFNQIHGTMVIPRYNTVSRPFCWLLFSDVSLEIIVDFSLFFIASNYLTPSEKITLQNVVYLHFLRVTIYGFEKINKKARGGKVAFFGGKRCYNQNNDDNRTH